VQGLNLDSLRNRFTIYYTLLFQVLFLLPAICQSSFSDKVTECYKDKKFEDLMYRFQHEGECYVGLKFPKIKIADLEGNMINNESLAGKVTLINFWFTACPPCIDEIPELNELYEIFHKKGVVFLAPSSDDKDTIEKFQKQYTELKSTVIPDATDLYRKTLSARSGYPTTIILDKEGIIRAYFSGGIVDLEKIELLLEELLDE